MFSVFTAVHSKKKINDATSSGWRRSEENDTFLAPDNFDFTREQIQSCSRVEKAAENLMHCILISHENGEREI